MLASILGLAKTFSCSGTLFKCSTWTALALLGIAVNAHGQSEGSDVLILKNGMVITGTIIEHVPGQSIKIRNDRGEIEEYSPDQIDEMTKLGPALEWQGSKAPRGQMAVTLGYGLEDGYNLGVGVRIGATVSNFLYIGGVFTYHFGKSETVDLVGISNLGVFEVNVNSLYTGAELGLDWSITSGVVVRPYSQFGFFSAMVSVSGAGESISDSEERFYICPGLLLQLDVGKVLFGADSRYVFVTGDGGSEASSFGLFGTLGFRF